MGSVSKGEKRWEAGIDTPHKHIHTYIHVHTYIHINIQYIYIYIILNYTHIIYKKLFKQQNIIDQSEYNINFHPRHQ